MIRVSIVGASGYVGGELCRLLLAHPQVELQQVSSRRLAGQFVHQRHPNLRARTALRFIDPEQLEPCDFLFLALPHGEAAAGIEHYAALAPRILDCSADFRLDCDRQYTSWYGRSHPARDWLLRFAYGLPEADRTKLVRTPFVSGVGCNATAVNLALLPLARAGLLPPQQPVIAEIKVGSSEGGRSSSTASQHAERQGVIRSYAPVGHRHTAEVRQVHALEQVHLSVTAIDRVRGAQATCHVLCEEPPSEKEMWQLYRDAVAEEPFLRIVHDRNGSYRHPDPKWLDGTNYADLGWAIDWERGRIVALSAIDNLMKGAAGSAVQCLNLMHGFPETQALEFAGLHPA